MIYIVKVTVYLFGDLVFVVDFFLLDTGLNG